VSGEGAAAHESEMCIRVSARYKHAQQLPNCVTLEGTLCPGPILKPRSPQGFDLRARIVTALNW